MAFRADHYPGEIHLNAATLSKPEKFVPTSHVHYASKLPWLHINDSLPKHDSFLDETANQT